MEIFLVRHAHAVDETIELPDPMRSLTPLGRDQSRKLGERLRWHDCKPSYIATSPLVRAVQTAELVTAELGSPLPVLVEPRLAPNHHARAVVAALAALPDDAVALLVGHEPGLSDVAALLINADVPALARAEAVRISDGGLRWRFRWDA